MKIMIEITSKFFSIHIDFVMLNYVYHMNMIFLESRVLILVLLCVMILIIIIVIIF